MDITFLGHSAFKIKGKTATIVTDPFDAKQLGLKFPPVEADIVTVSHQHFDHNNIEHVTNTKKVISGPGEYEVMGVSILGFSTFHDDKEGGNRGKNTIYVIETDNLRICHLGDLGHSLSQKLIEDLGDIDILLIPVGGFFTLDMPKVITVIQEVEPAYIIPMHYQVEGMTSDIYAKLAPLSVFLKEIGLPTETLPKFTVKKEEIGDEQKVIVLERKTT